MDINRSYPPFIAYLIKEINNGRSPVIYNNGSFRRSYLYSKDLCEIIDILLIDASNEIIDLCGNELVSPIELFNIVSQLMKSNIEPTFGDKNKYWSKFISLNESQSPLKTELIIKEINKETKCRNNKTLKYGWIPKYSIREGIRETINEYIKLIT